MKTIYDTRNAFDFDSLPSILTTKEDEELPSLVHSWYHKTSRPIKSLVREGKSFICEYVYSRSQRMRNSQYFQKVCFPDESKTQFVPRKLWSSNMDLRSQPRIYNLRWFRSSKKSTLEIEDREFLLSVMKMLEEVKNTPRVEHKIEITAAMIVVPTWATTRVKELFEEACTLASIEVIGFPYNRVSIAASLLADQQPEKKQGLLILDHGDYYLALHRLNWQENRGAFVIAEAMVMKQAGSNTLENYMGNTLLDEHAQNYQADRFNIDALKRSGASKLMRALHVSRVKIKYGMGFPAEMALENRTLFLNATSQMGLQFNVTGQHVKEAEEYYRDDITLNIRHILTDSRQLGAYLNSKFSQFLMLFRN